MRKFGIFLTVMIWLLSTQSFSAPIHDAVYQGNLAKVKKIIQANPKSVDAKNEYGRTPLHAAAACGYTGMAEYLLSKGASVDARDGSGCTPLMIAAQHGRTDVAKYLVSKGAKVNAKDNNQRTALHWAVADSDKSMLAFLIGKGADLYARDSSGNTPLHWAASRELLIYKFLASKMAVASMKNNAGETPDDLVKRFHGSPYGVTTSGRTTASQAQASAPAVTEPPAVTPPISQPPAPLTQISPPAAAPPVSEPSLPTPAQTPASSNATANADTPQTPEVKPLDGMWTGSGDNVSISFQVAKNGSVIRGLSANISSGSIEGDYVSLNNSRISFEKECAISGVGLDMGGVTITFDTPSTAHGSVSADIEDANAPPSQPWERKKLIHVSGNWTGKLGTGETAAGSGSVTQSPPAATPPAQANNAVPSAATADANKPSETRPRDGLWKGQNDKVTMFFEIANGGLLLQNLHIHLHSQGVSHYFDLSSFAIDLADVRLGESVSPDWGSLIYDLDIVFSSTTTAGGSVTEETASPFLINSDRSNVRLIKEDWAAQWVSVGDKTDDQTPSNTAADGNDGKAAGVRPVDGKWTTGEGDTLSISFEVASNGSIVRDLKGTVSEYLVGNIASIHIPISDTKELAISDGAFTSSSPSMNTIVSASFDSPSTAHGTVEADVPDPVAGSGKTRRMKRSWAAEAVKH